MKKKHVLVAVAALCVPAMAFADWSVNGTNFDCANGHDTNGYWGVPQYWGGDDLFFTNLNFDVSASADETVSKSDTLEVDLIAKPGFTFTGILVSVFGDYSIGGTGNDKSVEAIFGVAGSSVAAGAFPREQFDFQAAGVTSGAIPWNDSVSLSTLPSAAPPVTELHLSVDGTTIAISDGTGTAHITASFTDLKISVLTIPEPASLSLLAIGGLALIRRRR